MLQVQPRTTIYKVIRAELEACSTFNKRASSASEFQVPITTLKSGLGNREKAIRQPVISAKREISSNFARTMNNNSGVIHLSNNSGRPYGASASR